MYSLRIEGDGMREPHWHPVTAELGYVLTGRARMTVKSADGSVDTYELAAGDVYFIPRAFPHHIENLEDEETHFLVFFDQAAGARHRLHRRRRAPTRAGSWRRRSACRPQRYLRCRRCRATC